MTEGRLRAGHLAALAGAAAVLLSLWLPWYRLNLGALFGQITDAGSTGDVPAPIRDMAAGLAAALPATMDGTGWQVLEGADVALCVGAVLVLGLMVGAAGAFGAGVRIDPQLAGRLVALLGLGMTLLAAYHVVRQPTDGDLVLLRPGIWIATAGGVATLLGGLAAAAAPREAAPDVPVFTFAEEPAPLPVLGDPTTSVPPPAGA